MVFTRLFFLTLVASPLLLAQNAAPPTLDGLTILQKMGERYAGARSWHIEATEELTTSNEYSHNWTKTEMVGAVSGNRYHFEGRSWTGSALQISDGKTAWDLHPEEHAFTQQPAPANGYQRPRSYLPNEGPAQRAVNLLTEFSDLSSHYSSATRLPDEGVILSGVTIPCYVVRITSDQRKGPHPLSQTTEETLWIEKATWTVKKTEVHQMNEIAVTAAAHIPSEENSITMYSTVDLDGPPPESLFHFEPPPDAQQVARFAGRPFGTDTAVQIAPEVQLPGPDGKRSPLSSYRGKPVLLDFWATWCAPCIESLPKLAELNKEAAPKGLVLLSIDEDDEVKKGNDYFAQHHYGWPNVQDDGKIGEAFGEIGPPLYVLINGQGKIVFRGSAGAESALRKAIAALGPEFATLAREPKP